MKTKLDLLFIPSVKLKAVILTLPLLLCWQAAMATEPILMDGNPDCSDLGYGLFGFWVDLAPSGTYSLTEPPGVLRCGAPPDPGNSVTIASDGFTFDWASTLGIDAVIVKAGPNANVYFYAPESDGDAGLHGPINPSNGQPFPISHIEFCYDYEVDVVKETQTSFTRTYHWAIDMSSEGSNPLTLSGGQIYNYPFSWTASVTGYTEADWAVSGTITIQNNTPFDATISDVTDVISGFGSVPADCGVVFPHTLVAGDSLNCFYNSPLPDGSSRMNTATVTTSGPVGGGTAAADVIFGEPELVDESIMVTEVLSGYSEIIWYSEAPRTRYYSRQVGPYDVGGDYSFTDTVASTTFDQWIYDSYDCAVAVTVSCQTADLIIDGGENPTDVGDLDVSYSDGVFNVQYNLDAPWEIIETHVYIGDEMPEKSAPGKFQYQQGEIEFVTEKDSVCIAAYADVRMDTGEVDEFGDPIYLYEGTWAEADVNISIGKGGNWATCFIYDLP